MAMISVRETAGILVSVFTIFLVVSDGEAAPIKDKNQPRHRDPMVAFVCHLPAMHWTTGGWIPDNTTDCLKERNDILAYCQKIYSDLSVVDVVESAHVIRIGNWCQSGRKRLCNSQLYFVKPYRCLVADTTSSSSAKTTTSGVATSEEHLMGASTASPIALDDAYLHFIRNAPEPNLTEHEYYSRAREALRKRHRLKMSKVIEQWKRMNRTTEGAANVDRQSAEDLQKQITSRFQKLYSALVEEEKFEDHQLNELHQQRVQAELNQLKRDALEAFMKAIRSEPTDASLILRALKNYIRAEERDSEHTVSRSIHIRRKDPHEAEAVSSYVIEHLKVIDRRIRQSLDMLDRVPKQKKGILRLIEPFIRQFDSLDENIASVSAPIVNSNATTNDVITAETDADDDGDDVTAGPVVTVETRQDDESSSAPNEMETERNKEEEEEEDDEEEEEKEEEEEEEGGGTGVNQVHRVGNDVMTDETTTPVAMTTVGMATAAPPESTIKDRKSRDETAPNGVNEPAAAGVKGRYGVMHKVKLDHVAYMQKNEYHLNEMSLDPKESKTIKEPSSFLATPIGMTLFSIALVMLIAAALILLHRRVRSGSSSIPVPVGGPGARGGPSSSRTPRFLTARKQSSAKWSKGGISNGYENPTYRYLNSAAKA